MSHRMEDVAEKAGVSVTTVSHVMNKTRFVARDTRQRVLKAIQELSYYKDAHARKLARGQSDFFGLIVSDIENPFFPEIIKSFETAALNRRFDLMLSNTDYDSRRAQHAVQKMIENKVRGVAVMTSEFSPELAKQLTSNRVCVVFLDVGQPQPYISNIKVDYAKGIFQAIDHLYSLGHQAIGFIAGPQSLRSAAVRRKAFVDALRQYGLMTEATVEGNHRVDGGVKAIEDLLGRPNFPSAILCSNDLTAIGAITALQDAGLRVPEDVSIVGFDDIYLARIVRPALTTVNLPRERVGTLAFDALQKMLRSKARPGAEYVIETQLQIRKSTAPAREQRTEPRAEKIAGMG
ncbi:MAG TPA: LacI family DNA-binding transcriptional regulator [Terriglobia bacterium]|nr:LacI family DNA-binding transcriptional regulator [Terriglobia bacterium]